MTEAEFKTFAWESLEYMRESMGVCEEEWALSKYRVQETHVEDSTLRFSEGPEPDLTCRVQVVGSYATEDGIWRWAWDNDTISPNLKSDMEDVRAFGAEHSVPPLMTGAWESESEEVAWGMTALAARILNAKGVHRGPLAGLNVYMILNTIEPASKPA